jgi:ATP-dependent DNA ligase
VSEVPREISSVGYIIKPSPCFACIPARLISAQMFPSFQLLPVVPRSRPFNGSDWLFELKYDSFRSLAYIDHRGCRLVSRNGHVFALFADLALSIGQSLEGTTAVFDGEIGCVDRKGRPRFNDLLFRRGEARFFAFDLLYLGGNNLRYD